MAEPVEILRVVGTMDFVTQFDLDIPAYTVDPFILQGRVEDLLDTYLSRSMVEDQNHMSLGDFAFFLLSQAATDPKEQ